MKKTAFSTVLLLGGVFLVAAFVSARELKQSDPVSQQQLIQEDYYTCPMHPEVKSDETGTCPICGMDLVLASSLGNGTMMHMTGDTVHTMQGHMMQGRMMQGGHMEGDTMHMMQGRMMQGGHMEGDTLHMLQMRMMQDGHLAGDTLH